jgi:RNA polymerase sigma-70 factor (ECF subfamily)
MRGAPIPEGNIRAHRATVDAWLAATRAGDLAGVLAILDPDVVLRVDAALMPDRTADIVRGAAAVSRRALGFPARARISEFAIIDGKFGVVTAPHGRITGVLLLTLEHGRITAIEAIGDPARLARLDITLPS